MNSLLNKVIEVSKEVNMFSTPKQHVNEFQQIQITKLPYNK